MIRSSIYTILFLFTLTLPLSAQDARIDSLTQALSQVAADSDRVFTYNSLAFAYRPTDLEKAFDAADKGLKLAQKIDYNWGQGVLLRTKALLTSDDEKYSKSNEYHEESIKYFELVNRPDLVVRAYQSMAYNMGDISHYSEALQYDTKALITAEQHNDLIHLHNLRKYCGHLLLNHIHNDFLLLPRSEVVEPYNH